MPPVRTATSRSGKAERTHEENVERAFIAASRRCDRSLEARVESARRASEIHKARTGRALKITEEDVQNEEMYEEEDDLPLPYRHLTAGFQTSSPEFNRRFAAYLTTHVAIRTALEQSIIQSYAQQQQQQQAEFGGQPQFLNQQYQMFPSPMLAHQAQQSQNMVSSTQSTPISRYSPYTVPQLTKPPLPHQAGSISSPRTTSPIQNEALISPSLPENPEPTTLPLTGSTGRSTEPSSAPLVSEAHPAAGNFSQTIFLRGSSQNQFLPPNLVDLSSFDGPMSTSMPAETLSLLGQNMGFNHSTYNIPETAMKPNPYGNINSTHFSSSEKLSSDTGQVPSGLNATLLPEVPVQEGSLSSPKLSYLDEHLQSISVGGTPSAGEEVDENDWRYFLNRNEPWLFSD